MARAPLLVHAGAWAPIIVVVAAARFGVRRLSRARWLVVGSALVSLVADVVSLVLSRQGINNHLVSYLYTPLATGLLLGALGLWQEGPVLRVAYRVVIATYAVAWVALVAMTENTTTFSRIAVPFDALVVAVAAASVVVVRAGASHYSLPQCDWFWVATGLLVRSAATATLGPLAAYLVATDPATVIVAYEMKSGIDVLAAIAIAKGVSCPLQSSGRSS